MQENAHESIIIKEVQLLLAQKGTSLEASQYPQEDPWAWGLGQQTAGSKQPGLDTKSRKSGARIQNPEGSNENSIPLNYWLLATGFYV
jgi:hypothetical protein